MSADLKTAWLEQELDKTQKEARMNNRWLSTIVEALIVGLMLSLTLAALVYVRPGTLVAAENPAELTAVESAEQLREALAEIRGRASLDPNSGFYYDVANRALLGLEGRPEQ